VRRPGARSLAYIVATFVTAAPLVGLAPDPLLENQWHLKGTSEEVAGANVRGVWSFVTGVGATIGIVDDGLQRTHPDLVANYIAGLSYDFNNDDPDPSPSSTNRHGTAVAGVAAAVGDNGIGISGAAPDSGLAGLRLISAPSSDADEAAALGHEPQAIDILNNSWGPSDDGGTLEGPGPLTLVAMESAAVNGRSSLGRLFVWAAGNGLSAWDNCNFDGYANSRFTIAVGALSDVGAQANYSEPCAAMFVTAPSNGGARAITTTDLQGAQGYSSTDYTNSFGGTSSAAPLVSGILGLLLSHNAALTRRDVEHILAASSVQLQPADPGWTTGPYPHNEKFGFGRIDAGAAVAMTGNWTHVSPEVSTPLLTRNLGVPIPDDNAVGVTDSIVLNSSYNSFEVERVEVDFNASHEWRGDLEVTLTSPSGVQSHLATIRPVDGGVQFPNWRFGSVRHWGETADGTWTLRVTDRAAQFVGTWHGWSLRLFGTHDCAYALSPPSASFAAAGGSGSLTVTATPGCGWTASPSPSWIFITGDASGNGNGTVTYSVAANASMSSRAGSIHVAGQTHGITQAGVAVNSVSVLTPNGGERAYAATPLYIDWSANEATTIKAFNVQVSIDNGATFSPVAGCTSLGPEARRCVWATPGPPSTKALARVIAVDVNGNTAVDRSDAVFRIITGAASLTITAPNATANWGIGSQQIIRWSHNLGPASTVRLDISRDGGTSWNVLSAAVANNLSGVSYSWTVTGPPSSLVRFRATWNGGAAFATSLRMTIAAPYIKVTAPNTAQNWGIGTLRRIAWQHNLGAAAFVRVEISRDGTAWSVLAASVKSTTATTGLYDWETLGPATATARIRVTWLANGAMSLGSDVVFSIAAPVVTMIKPNTAADGWTVGSTRTIKWNHNLGSRESVKIELSRNGGATYTVVLVAATVSDGVHQIVVDATWATASAKVRVTWLQAADVVDVSDSTFAIQW
jgi:subtilisin-like proprotein convertase family protein